LDDDVKAKLDQAVRARGKSFKETVNDSKMAAASVSTGEPVRLSVGTVFTTPLERASYRVFAAAR
jgi:hypothetical protein